MEDTRFRFTRSLLAAIIFFAAYAMVLCLVLATLPAGGVRGLAILVLAGLAWRDLRSCGLYDRDRAGGLKLYRQRWQLLLSNKWTSVDLAVYYRGQLFIILCWRAQNSQRMHYAVVWRDMLAPTQWRLLTVYLSLFPVTLASDA